MRSLEGFGMFDNSFVGPSDASNHLEWDPVFCIRATRELLSRHMHMITTGEIILSLSLFEFHQFSLQLGSEYRSLSSREIPAPQNIKCSPLLIFQI
jgi:hypothetical protein